IASSAGLISYDGTTWSVYDTSNSNISSQSVERIFISPTGEKWIATYDGMERFDGSNWILYDYSVAPFAFYNTTDLAFRNNEVFVATHGDFSQGEGLAKFDGTVWTELNPSNSGLPYTRVECLDVDTSGNLWIGNYDSFGSTSAIVKFDGTNWIVDSTGLPEIINHLVIDGGNRFFTGIESMGLHEYDGSGFAKINTSNSGLNINGGSEIFIDDQQEIWTNNYLGFAHFNRQSWQVFDSTNSGFLNAAILSIAKDHSGNNWIGTNEGLVKYDGTNWFRYDTSNSGLTNTYVNAVNVDADNSVWAGTNAGPFRFDGTTWTNFFNPAGSHIEKVFNTPDGDVWMTSPGYGLNRFDRVNNWTNYLPPGGGGCHGGALDKNGNVWYAGNNLYKWDGNAWTMYSTADGLPWNYVTALAVDTNGILWIGTQSGFCSYNGSTFNNFSVSNSGLTSNFISDIEVDAFNNKWIGTSAGISVYNENGVVMGIEDQGFPKHADISFYPNPATDFMVVDLSHITTDMISLTVTDVLGKELLVVQKADNFAKIDISSLSAGIYLGKLTSEKGEILTKKFIVQ
ncbi:MAG: T9SS type A sorting domain-containing protein, partial [Bacteroidetes bacterium]|nr:T9SS type A sorting domain-containing protein [Bacteroidota bacterium]